MAWSSGIICIRGWRVVVVGFFNFFVHEDGRGFVSPPRMPPTAKMRDIQDDRRSTRRNTEYIYFSFN